MSLVINDTIPIIDATIIYYKLIIFFTPLETKTSNIRHPQTSFAEGKDHESLLNLC